MPYKLKKVIDSTGAILWNVFNQRIAAKSGIMFKNRVPAVELFPDQFERISMAEYNAINVNSDLKGKLTSAHLLMKSK